MWEKRNVCRVLIRGPEVNWALAKLGRGWGIIFKRNLRKYYGTGYIWLRLRTNEEDHEHSYS
jgi:hypothetical protein